jgi:hypothetical protein
LSHNVLLVIGTFCMQVPDLTYVVAKGQVFLFTKLQLRGPILKPEDETLVDVYINFDTKKGWRRNLLKKDISISPIVWVGSKSEIEIKLGV